MQRGNGLKRTTGSLTSDEPTGDLDIKRSRNTPRVFISYSHDPHATDDDHVAVGEQERQRGRDRHRLYVRDLSDYLREHGIDCIIDQYYENEPPESGWPRWMEKQIEESDFVLMVCSSSYYECIRREERAQATEQGLGSKFEGCIIYGYLSKNPASVRKFIPVFFGRRVAKQIPTLVAQSNSYQILFPLDMEMPEQKDLKKLYGVLVGNKVELPPLGEKNLSVGDGTGEKDEEDQEGPSHKTDRKESIPEQVRRLTAFHLTLQDSLEVSVKSVSDYFCVIECTHKDALQLIHCLDTPWSEYTDELEGKRNLEEVHCIAELPMISKIQSLEVNADIKMRHEGVYYNDLADYQSKDIDFYSSDFTGKAGIECKLKSGESDEDTVPLCSLEEVCPSYDAAVHPMKCVHVHCKVRGEIHQASLTATIDNVCVKSVSLENIRTTIKASITQQR